MKSFEASAHIDVAAPLGSYSVAIQHVPAIARAVDLSARVLILDEPPASLDRHEAEAGVDDHQTDMDATSARHATASVG